MTVLVIAISSLLLAAAPGDAAEGVDRALAEASRRYDLDAALEVLASARALAGRAPDGPGRELTVRAGLLAAELLRARFEETSAKDRTMRERLGAQIDAIALEALGSMRTLAENSERHRMEADLTATLIRSDFRAKKYETRFKDAVARALELDPKNARALVSSAKPFLFAPPGRGRDLKEGIAVLDRALSLDPRLETALLLRAHARNALGDRAGARGDWRAVLAINPDCAPARRELEKAAAAER
jgi:tetratricopeptide (TPR) repeat protein